MLLAPKAWLLQGKGAAQLGYVDHDARAALGWDAFRPWGMDLFLTLAQPGVKEALEYPLGKCPPCYLPVFIGGSCQVEEIIIKL